MTESESDFRITTDTPYLVLTGNQRVSLVRILEKIDRGVAAPHCNLPEIRDPYCCFAVERNCQISPIFSRLLSLQWHHNGRDSVSNHQPHDCFLNRLLRHRSKITSKLCVTGLCAGNSPEFPAQMASNAENISIWWRHHVSDNHKIIPPTQWHRSHPEESG